MVKLICDISTEGEIETRKVQYYIWVHGDSNGLIMFKAKLEMVKWVRAKWERAKWEYSACAEASEFPSELWTPLAYE
jgi:hypothetical protein